MVPRNSERRLVFEETSQRQTYARMSEIAGSSQARVSALCGALHVDAGVQPAGVASEQRFEKISLH